ncbi:MAG TPA: vWA domain-containing protein [Steroidobacteraceae bacterium]|nr:vWA domain-containing protein [Steroidobacteraceae bacterium]HNS26657.1 vWA domain-containing protein [Steroidobacteraceae bacterium]
MRKRRQTEVFSLSFLDCICCGFGAVVLFYTVVSAQSGVERIRKTEDLAAEVRKLEDEVLEGTRNLVVLRNTLEKTSSETASAASRATRLIEELKQARDQGPIIDNTTLAQREHIEKLKADLRSLEESTRRLEAASKDVAPPGDAVKVTRGADRRYITGLRLHGKHVLVLLDSSASMLDEDIVNVIRLRNTGDATRRAAAKWRRGVATVSWLAGQIPPGSSYQVYRFDTKPEPVLADTAGNWLKGGDQATGDRLLEALDEVVPQNGTSLVNAFRAIRQLSPAPDQVILITDGLPTQGASPPAVRRYIDAGGRARLFEDAIKALPPRTPIDVVLLPMRGDNPAAHAFWRLARNSGGAYLMPSKDWP